MYLIFNALSTYSKRLEFSSTLRTDSRNGSMIPTIMTPQLIVTFMQGHRHIALHATRRLSTRHTLDLRRIAPAILKENNLLFIRQTLTNPIYQGVAEMPVHLFSIVLTAKIDKFNIRQFHPAKTLGKRHQAIYTSLRQIIRFNGRSGCSQEHFCAMLFRQHDSRSPCMVTGIRFCLLITGIMFFIHNDQTQIGDRKKDCTSRPKHYIVIGCLRFIVRDLIVSLFTLCVGKPTMINNQTITKDELKARSQLCG